MSRNTKDAARTEAAGAVNLFAHPIAGAAAWTAFSFGLASQAFGFWIGAMSGAGSAARGLLDAEEKPDSRGEAAADQPRSALPVTAAERARVTDNLKAIAGVGPKLEQVLNGLGVRSFEQIASWTDEEIAAVEETLGFSGRIVRDDWVGQATALKENRSTGE